VQACAPAMAEPAGLRDEAARADSVRVALEADTAGVAAARCGYDSVQAVAFPTAAVSAEQQRAGWPAPEAVLWAGSIVPVDAAAPMAVHSVAAVREPADLDAVVPTAARTAVTAAGSADAAPVQAPRAAASVVGAAVVFAVPVPVELVASYSDSGLRLAVPADAASQRADQAHCSLPA